MRKALSRMVYNANKTFSFICLLLCKHSHRIRENRKLINRNLYTINPCLKQMLSLWQTTYTKIHFVNIEELQQHNGSFDLIEFIVGVRIMLFRLNDAVRGGALSPKASQSEQIKHTFSQRLISGFLIIIISDGHQQANRWYGWYSVNKMVWNIEGNIHNGNQEEDHAGCIETKGIESVFQLRCISNDAMLAGHSCA